MLLKKLQTRTFPYQKWKKKETFLKHKAGFLHINYKYIATEGF